MFLRLSPHQKNILNSIWKIAGPTRLYSVEQTKPSLSTVHRGTHFETRSIALLARYLSMSLKRVGGKGDGGVDMLGWWWLPYASNSASTVDQRRRIRVLAQCKAEKKKTGPKYVRELEGVLHRYHASDFLEKNIDVDSLNPHGLSYTTPPAAKVKHIPTLGLLISESPFTKATVLHAQSSSIPLLLLYLPPEEEDPAVASQSVLGTAMWNPALGGDKGLLGGHMEIRWERTPKGPDRPGLWWHNTKLPSWVPAEATLGTKTTIYDVADGGPMTSVA